MRRLVLAVSALALMSSAALARDVQGVVKHFNSATRTITLQDGRTYTVPRHVAVPRMRAGEKVSIMFNGEGDQIRNVFAGSRSTSR